MASIFWDARGILFIDYLENDKSINSDYYMALLDGLSAEIKKKWPHMQKKNVHNASCRKSMKMMVKLNELSLKLLPHPLSSPDLACSDYCLYADLNKNAPGKNIWLQ